METSEANFEETSKIEKEKVLLKREWAFWENYDSKKEKDYSKLLKEIFNFKDIISFWQFMNNYPGSDIKKIFFDGECIRYFFKEKFRIIALNIFQKGIKPEWEDESNKKGNILTLAYTINSGIDDFLVKAQELWIKLICLLIGETLPFCHNINGIRFVDKTKLAYGYNKIMISFKYEIWTNSNMKEDELNELKNYCTKEFGCQGTIKPIK